MNLEFVLYDHFTPALIAHQQKIKDIEEAIHEPHEDPFEDDGAYMDDDKD